MYLALVARRDETGTSKSLRASTDLKMKIKKMIMIMILKEIKVWTKREIENKE